MGRGLSVLVGTACLCIIGATVWIAVSVFADRAMGRASDAEESAAKADVCGQVIDAFDRGNSAPARVMAGERGAARYVDECRAFLAANPAPSAE